MVPQAGFNFFYKKMTPKKTLDDVIEYAEKMRHYTHKKEWYYILDYLYQYRDSRKILRTDNIVSYFGNSPVVKIDKEYFAIGSYARKYTAWYCHRVKWQDISGNWSCDDDDTYVIDNYGKIICRLVGWDLREVYPEKE